MLRSFWFLEQSHQHLGQCIQNPGLFEILSEFFFLGIVRITAAAITIVVVGIVVVIGIGIAGTRRDIFARIVRLLQTKYQK